MLKLENMFFAAQKQLYVKAFIGLFVISITVISTVGLFGSTEMQATHHQQSSLLGSSIASTLDNDEIDQLEDLILWDNFGSASSHVGLAALLLAVMFSILTQFKLLTSRTSQFFSRLYSKPPWFSLALQEAFSKGLINSKAYKTRSLCWHRGLFPALLLCD